MKGLWVGGISSMVLVGTRASGGEVGSASFFDREREVRTAPKKTRPRIRIAAPMMIACFLVILIKLYRI